MAQGTRTLSEHKSSLRGHGRKKGTDPRAEKGSVSRGMSLIEIMVVVSIIAILATIVVYVSGNISDNAKSNQTKQIMETLTSAITEYHDIYGNWPPRPRFPGGCIPSCPDWNHGEVYGPNEHPGFRYYSASVVDDISVTDDSRFQITFGKGEADDNNWVVESIEGLHYYLSHEPATKTLLSKVSEEAIKTKTVMVSGKLEPQLIRLRYTPYMLETSMVIVDPWGTHLRYHRHDNINNGVPYFRSAGPNEGFGNDDDIYSYDR